MSFGCLGEKTAYVEEYTPALLFPISREIARLKLQLDQVPFRGVDQWTAYELSWLGRKGKPEVALASFLFPFNSPFLIESKSFKLYLNSFNQSRFQSAEEVREHLEADLSKAAGAPVGVYFKRLDQVQEPEGLLLDALDIETDFYTPHPEFLQASGSICEERLYSNLLKSNCLATGQPDFGTLLIHYVGQQIDHVGLLKYIISLRRHLGFAEHCVEEIFVEILRRCKPEKLSIEARYTRRGGLDINPFRTNFEEPPKSRRFIRQ